MCNAPAFLFCSHSCFSVIFTGMDVRLGQCSNSQEEPLRPNVLLLGFFLPQMNGAGWGMLGVGWVKLHVPFPGWVLSYPLTLPVFLLAPHCPPPMEASGSYALLT